jgi:hypothetical protein
MRISISIAARKEETRVNGTTPENLYTIGMEIAKLKQTLSGLLCYILFLGGGELWPGTVEGFSRNALHQDEGVSVFLP